MVLCLLRTQLEKMCANPRRCAWCEDSDANQIDHIRPKALYPEQTFAWPNFLRACGGCNNVKRDRFAITAAERLVDVTRQRNAPVVPPLGGSQALIDPRVEDPLEFLELEIVYTFRFLPRIGLSELDENRAKYSIRLLDRNREVLCSGRKNAYGDNRVRLADFRATRDGGVSDHELNRFVAGFLGRPHPTVWREVQRQHERIQELRDLFRDVPEALLWR